MTVVTGVTKTSVGQEGKVGLCWSVHTWSTLDAASPSAPLSSSSCSSLPGASTCKRCEPECEFILTVSEGVSRCKVEWLVIREAQLGEEETLPLHQPVWIIVWIELK